MLLPGGSAALQFLLNSISFLLVLLVVVFFPLHHLQGFVDHPALSDPVTDTIYTSVWSFSKQLTSNCHRNEHALRSSSYRQRCMSSHNYLICRACRLDFFMNFWEVLNISCRGRQTHSSSEIRWIPHIWTLFFPVYHSFTHFIAGFPGNNESTTANCCAPAPWNTAVWNSCFQVDNENVRILSRLAIFVLFPQTV